MTNKSNGIPNRLKSKDCAKHFYTAMDLAGMRPPKAGIERYLYLIWSCISTILGATFSFGLILSVAIDYENLTPGDLFNVLLLMMNVVGGYARCAVVLAYSSCPDNASLVLDKLDDFLKEGSDCVKINKAVEFCQYIFMMFVKLYNGFVLASLIAAVVMGHPPWLLYNPFFDWRHGGLQFWTQVIAEYLIGFLFAIVMLVVDTCPLLFMITFRAHINVLKDKIRNLRCDPHKSEVDNYDDLVNCIMYHKLIIQCCELMRPLITRIVFAQFLLIGADLALGLIKVVYFFDIIEFISVLFYIMAVVVETFPFSYCCDLLVEDCEELTNLLAHSHWLNAQPKYKSTLRIFLMRLQKPITFNAGGIFPISLNTNIQVAKCAFTVLTILQNTDLVENLE